MGLQIRTYVNGEQKFIELYGDENITMNVSFAEIQDIRKKNSSYTQEFKVPGSKTNNEIFNYFFDINAVALDFNPKLKFEADLIYDGYEIFNGFIRLNSVTINKLEKIYSVTYYTQVGDLAANIGDKALCNVDTSSLNHSLYNNEVAFTTFFDPSMHNPQVIRDTNPVYAQFLDTYNFGWDGPVSQGEVQYFLTYRGYNYTGSTTGTIEDINYVETPILQYSGVTRFFDHFSSPVPFTYLMPSLRIKKLYELICNQAGYFIQSEFFETDYFKRYYLPLSFNTEEPDMAEADNFDYYWVNTSGQSLGTTGITYNIVGNANTFPRRLVNPREIIRDNLGFNPVTDNVGPSNINEWLFQLPYGLINYEYEIITEYTGSTVGSGNIVNLGTIVFNQYVNFDPITSTLVGNPVSATQLLAYSDNNSGGSTILVNNSASLFNTSFNNFYYFITFTPIDPVEDVKVNEVSFSAITETTRLPKIIELYKEMSCDHKQIDFISDINRMFNLVVVEHPIKPNTIIIEPVVNYIGKGENLDWTDKIDFNSPQTLFPTTTLINGSIFASNKKDNDFINTEFFKRSNLTFGEQFFDLGIEYKNEKTMLTQNLGQNTDYYLNASGDTNPALSCFFITKENNVDGITNFEFRPFRSLPRVVFNGVPIPTGNTQQNPIFYSSRGGFPFYSLFNSISQPTGDIKNLNRLTTYPFAIEGFSHYITYDQSDVFTDDELVYPQLENQYDRYYYDYIEDLISEDNKILQCKMYLTPWEVSQLYFNETITIKNARFRINKITNLSLIEPGICDVELVKLTRDYIPTPTLFYDLVNCDDPCDIIHTHTDLVFNIFAFEGNIVNITTNWSNSGEPTIKKYQVVRSSWNPDYTYETPYFTIGSEPVRYFSGITPYDYNVLFNYQTFSACSATTSTYKLDVINELEDGFVLDDCYEFEITNTGLTSTTITYLDCSRNIQSVSIPSGSVYTVCAIGGSIEGRDIRICYSSIIACTPPVPTPDLTPQPTPTLTATPPVTPSMTPSSGRCRENVRLRVTTEGYIQYILCDGETPVLAYVFPGFQNIPDCIEYASLQSASITPSAIFTISSPGFPC